jgi:transposase
LLEPELEHAAPINATAMRNAVLRTRMSDHLLTSGSPRPRQGESIPRLVEVLVGVAGTGSYGAGLTRHLQAIGMTVVEVDRPNRQRRRRSGKSDSHDAVSAARAAFAGYALGAPKTRDGNVEAIRVLRLARSSATRDRTRR